MTANIQRKTYIRLVQRLKFSGRGLADIAGNGEADRLAKEAAKEVEDVPDDKGETSQADV